MSQKVGENNNKVYRVVLTGGPCGGKTTGQARLCTFFENLGWKVYRVPETATILMGGGVKWTDLTEEEAYRFQKNLLITMMQIEKSYFDLAASSRCKCLVICDRGAMDASAYLKPKQWQRMKGEMSWNEVELRDSRYNQVVHMVSSANGAEAFYHIENHVTRHEGLEVARQLDSLTSQAWVGHPYFDVIDNSTDFERKVVRMIAAVCNRLGIDIGDRLSLDSKKRKFLVTSLPDEAKYPQFQDFIVVHDYLVTPNCKMQARIRRRGQSVKWDTDKNRWDLETDTKNLVHVSCVSVAEDVGPSQPAENRVFMCGTDLDFSNWTYTHAIRRPEINKESPELKMQISAREYELLLAQRDVTRYSVFKRRRCFLWNNHYFQMDIYQEPCHPRCQGLIILETYTTLKGRQLELPSFLKISGEVTNEPRYSMYNLSRIDVSAGGGRKSKGSIEAGLNGVCKGTDAEAPEDTTGAGHDHTTSSDSGAECVLNGSV